VSEDNSEKKGLSERLFEVADNKRKLFIMCLVIFITTCILSVIIIPKYRGIFVNIDVALPVLTQFYLSFSWILSITAYGFISAALIIVEMLVGNIKVRKGIYIAAGLIGILNIVMFFLSIFMPIMNLQSEI
jgi:type II secretory pathway component PulF